MTRNDYWQEMLGQYSHFLQRKKRIPLRNSRLKEELNLAHWMQLNDRRKLSCEQQKSLSNIVPAWRALASVDRRWFDRYTLLRKYVKRKGNLPIGAVFIDDFDISQWLRRQRSDFRCGKLSEIKIFILDSILGWRSREIPKKSINIALWRQRYRSLRRYIVNNGMMPGTYCVVGGEPLGMWVSRIYQARREGRVPEDVIKAFDSIEGWRWSRRGN